VSVYKVTWKTKDGLIRQILLYRVWAGMKSRCTIPSASNYRNYGGRGISVCDAWSRSFLLFRSWALGNGYRKGLQIDRIDNYSGYMPSNCKWSTSKEQASNRRHTGAMHVSRGKGEDNPAAKLTNGDVLTIRGLLMEGCKRKYVAEFFDVSYQTIALIDNKKTWRHI